MATLRNDIPGLLKIDKQGIRTFILLCRLDKPIQEFRLMADNLENDINELKISTDQKKNQIADLLKIKVQYKSNMQEKDKEILTIKETKRRLKTLHSALKISIEESEITIEELKLKIQEKRDLIDEVISKNDHTFLSLLFCVHQATVSIYYVYDVNI